MLISLLADNPLAFLLVATGLVAAITIHEFAHAFVADRLGDPTPGSQGRLTLNPLAHLDPMGTFLIFIFGFGWGRPVMFDPYNLKNPKRDITLIALAGPASNLLLATILGILMRLAFAYSPTAGFFSTVFADAIYLNIMLAIFNLVPVHPLDGGKILIGILPHNLAIEAQDILNRYGILILLLLILPIGGTSAISQLIGPPIRFLARIILPL